MFKRIKTFSIYKFAKGHKKWVSIGDARSVVALMVMLALAGTSSFVRGMESRRGTIDKGIASEDCNGPSAEA